MASGPSMTVDDAEYCRTRADAVYTVNETSFLAPWATVAYAADATFWLTHGGLPEFSGEKFTADAKAAAKYGLRHVRVDHGLVWSDTPGLLAGGGNSGFQALNLAVQHGFGHIVLLGFDMGYSGQQKHWWTGKLHGTPPRASHYAAWVAAFRRAAPVISARVINATRHTSLFCFDQIPLEKVF